MKISPVKDDDNRASESPSLRPKDDGRVGWASDLGGRSRADGMVDWAGDLCERQA